MAEHWKTQGKATVLGTEFGAARHSSGCGIYDWSEAHSIAERLPSHLTAEEIVLTGKHESAFSTPLRAN